MGLDTLPLPVQTLHRASPGVLPMSPELLALIGRAEQLLTRLEAVLPQPLRAPDWSASIAFRYRPRAGAGVIEPERQVATIQ